MNRPFQDRNAFKDLFQQYFNPLVNFVYSRYVKDHETSKDIIQATFSKIWEKRNSITITSSVKSYLFQAARNKALDYIRAKAENTLELEEDVREYEVEDKVLDKDANSFLIREEIVNCINDMKPKMRHIFELNKFRGFSYEEIAADLEISKRTVESNMAKAFAILREQLKNKEVFNE